MNMPKERVYPKYQLSLYIRRQYCENPEKISESVFEISIAY